MKVIDANTGALLREGMTFRNVMGVIRVVRINPGLTSASMIYDHSPDGRRWTRRVAPLQVRWTHPSFFLQHVAFLPS